MRKLNGVMVVGSVNQDLVTRVPRLPVDGETVLGNRIGPMTLGGKGANQAIAAARLGAITQLVAAVASADHVEIAHELQGHGVGTTWLNGVPQPTGWAHILLSGDGSNLIVVEAGANAVLAAADVNSAVLEAQPAVVLTQFEISVAVARQAMRTGHEIGALTVCNASPALDLPMLDGVHIDVLVVNRNEAEIMSGRKQLSEATECLAQRTGGTVIVTLGADGVLVAAPAATTTSIPAVVAPRVLDTTGAGDVFAGALACGLAAGQSVLKAIGLAQRAASWMVGELGTLGPRSDDI